MAPVVLRMDVHCLGCARKIRKAIKNLYGVQNVWASPDTGLVVVSGWADASALQRRIQHKIRRPVTVFSDGTVPPEWQPRALPPPPPQGYPPYAGMMHLGPRQYAAPPPRAVYRYAHVPRYLPPGEPSVCFEDEKPNGCCVQ